METVLFSGIFVCLTLLTFLAFRHAFQLGPSVPETPAFWLRPRVMGGLSKPLANVFGRSIKKDNDLKAELVRAGVYHSTALENFLAVRNLAILLTAIWIVLLFVIDMFAEKEWIGIAIGLTLIASIYSLPRLILVSRGKKRIQRIEKAIPDALDMIVMAMTSGLPLNRALDRVANELKLTYRDLAKELQIVAHQSNTFSLEAAFEGFAKRIELPEIVSLSTLIGQSQKLGGKLANSLSDYSKRIRRDRQRRAEQAGNTASIKLLLPVVLCLAPPIFILLVGPALLDFRNFINRERENHGQQIQQANDSERAFSRTSDLFESDTNRSVY